MTTPTSTPHKLVLVMLPTALSGVLLVSISDSALAQWLFLNTTYYFLMATVLCWVGTYLYAARDLRREGVLAWLKENWPGLVVALSVTVVVGFAVEPALRMLSDEANLVGTSKNLFASRSPTFTVSGKNYYGSYWDVDVVIDQRPTLFPFLVSLVHSALGYSYQNVFVFNLVVLPAFLLVSYRLAKSLGGETFGVVASLMVVAHPVLMSSVRSGGFDFLAAFFALLVVKSVFDFAHGGRPEQLAVLWMNLWMLAGVRYESALFILPVVGLLLVFGMVSRSTLRPLAFVYAMTPAFLLPRVWSSLLRGSVPKQDPGTVTFSVGHFFDHVGEYFQPLLKPSGSFPAHGNLLIALGVVGCAAGLRWMVHGVRARNWKAPELRFALVVAAWMSLQAIIVFAYAWGRAQYPSSARLLIPIDIFFSFAAAFFLTRALERWRPFVPVLLAAAVLVTQVSVASQGRMMNRLTQTRESATTWSFFERLQDRRILIVTDRPNHFTIMNYGAMSFESAKRDPFLFTALQRRLFQDIYVIQQLTLSTSQPLPGYEFWSDRKLEAVFEFQNDADVLVRISRVAR